MNTNMTYKNKNKTIISSVLVSVVFLFSTQLAQASEITSENIINVVNREREARMIHPLNKSGLLTKAAEDKSRHMLIYNYFEHYALGLTPWSFIINSGYDYSIAGENLAMGFKTSEGIVEAWMDSPTHRANILNPNYEDIGVGVVRGEFTQNDKIINTVMTTNMLAKPKPAINRIFNRIVESFNNLFK
jgi:uncharacterized protein YkwD